MKKKLLVLCLATTLAMTLCACNTKVTVENQEQESSTTQSSEDVEDNSSLQPSETDEPSSNKETDIKDETTTTTESTSEDTKESNETNADNKNDQSTEETTNSQITNDTTLQDGKWVNFDKMQFSVNGKTYTLGVTTLQEMIDDGVTFDEDDLATAGNNVEPNYVSSGFKIVLGEYWSAQVYVGNYTDANTPANELPIVEFYLPNHPDETQNILSFAFPLDLTEEQLLNQCGEPDEKDLRGLEDEYGSNTYEYIKESEVYYSDSSFQFEFLKGELRYLNMTYIP